jgi:hypothetical protein
MLSTAHFENAAPLLVDLDLGALLTARERLEAGEEAALADLMNTLALAGKSRAFRKLAAIAGASVEDILAAETSPAGFQDMERAAAVRPFLEVFQEAMGFFSALVPSPSGIPASLNPPAGEAAAEPKAPESIPSAAS